MASRLRAEDGYAIVIALALMVVGLAAAAAALSEVISARDNANRDLRSKRAVQAADAGLQTELYRANQVNLGSLKLSSGINLSTIITQLLTCPVPQINAQGQVIGIQFVAIASVGKPCPANSASGISNPGPNQEAVGHHSYYQVQMVPGTSSVGDFVTLNPKIVASGVDDNANATDPRRYVSRRVEAVLAPIMPWRTLEALHNLQFDVPSLLSVLGLKLAGTSTFNGTAAAGNNLVLNGTAGLANIFTAAGVSLSGGLTEPSALDYCGTYTHPNITANLTLGSITQPSSGCSGLVNRQAVQISATKQDCVPTAGVETCSSDAGFGSSYVGGNQDEIYNTNGATTISFGPGDYVLCSFETNGPVSLNPSSTQAVRIFIDSPSSTRCKNFVNHSGSLPSHFIAGPGNFIATQGVGWNALSGTLSSTHPSQAQIYVAGNGTNDGTTVYSTGMLGGQSMFLYAPTSNVTVTAGQTCVLGTCVVVGTLAGAFIGYDIDVSATVVTQDLGLLNYPLSTTLGPFHVQQYIECQPQYPLPSPDPTTGC
jgi:hypothetical protein